MTVAVVAAWALWWLRWSIPVGARPTVRTAMGAVAVVTAAFAIRRPSLLVPMVVIWFGIRRRKATARRVRERRRRAGVPEVVDTFVVALSAGLTPRRALEEVVGVLRGPLAGDVTDAARRLRQGASLPEAVDLWRGPDEPLDQLAAVLCACDRHGAAGLEQLRECASQSRRLERRRVEAQLRRLPVRLLGPLVVCILPALLLASFGPVVVSSLSDFAVPP